jgi:hypothetical protein
MKISDLNAPNLNGLSTGSIASSPGIAAYGRAGRASYGAATDQVQISGASRIASSALVQHAARLDQLKAQIASGEYNPSPDAIGRAMVSEMLAKG